MSICDPISLMPCTVDTATSWCRWRAQPRARQYNPFEPWDLERLELELSVATGDLTDKSRDGFRWLVGNKGTIVGTAMAHPVSWRMGHASIGVLIDEDWHGHGIGTTATRLLTERLFDAGLRRVMAYISPGNTASIRMVEGLGFCREGVLRDHVLIEGRPSDQALYALLERDWRRSTGEWAIP